MIDPTQPLDINEPAKQGNSKHNATSFKPGQSGNPKGRPHKGYSITEAFKHMLGADPEKKQEIVDRIMTAATTGDMTAAKMIWSYMDGMPAQAVDMTSLGEKLDPGVKTIILDTKPAEKVIDK